MTLISVRILDFNESARLSFPVKFFFLLSVFVQTAASPRVVVSDLDGALLFMVLEFLSVKFIRLHFFAVFLVIHPIVSFCGQFHLLRACPLPPIAELLPITVYSHGFPIFSRRIENLEIDVVLLPLVIDHDIFYFWSFFILILKWPMTLSTFLIAIVAPFVILTDVIIFIMFFLENVAILRFCLLFFKKFHIGYPVEAALVFLEMPLVKKDVFVHKVAFVAVGLGKHNVVSDPNMSFRPSHHISILDIPRPELRDISDDSKLLTIISIKLYFQSQFMTLISLG